MGKNQALNQALFHATGQGMPALLERSQRSQDTPRDLIDVLCPIEGWSNPYAQVFDFCSIWKWFAKNGDFRDGIGVKASDELFATQYHHLSLIDIEGEAVLGCASCDSFRIAGYGCDPMLEIFREKGVVDLGAVREDHMARTTENGWQVVDESQEE